MEFNKKILADLLVVIGLASFTSWYLLNAWFASSQPENLILILPIAVITLAMCSLEFIQQCRTGTTSAHEERETAETTGPIIGIFSIYVITLEWLGFDLATILFIATFLWLQGERRWFWIVGYSLCFGLLVTLFFSYMLPYPMPMSLFPTDY